MAVDVSIAVLSYNGRDILPRCLTALCRQDAGVSKEIIVLDNGSSDGTANMVESDFPEVTLIVNERNEYFTKPYNAMARVASGRYFLILSNDVEARGDTLERLIAFMDAHPEVGAVAPRSCEPDGHVEAICRREYTFFGLLLEFSVLGGLLKRWVARWREYHLYGERFEVPRRADIVQDSCLLTRREVIQRTGLYDEKFKLYFTEDDLCKRVREAGWEVFYYPEASVEHVHCYTTQRSSPVGIKWIYTQDMLRYSRKYFGAWRTNLILCPLAYLNLSIRFVVAVWRKARRGGIVA